MPQASFPRPEILAPAGNAEMLRAAVFAGADAVYLGLDGYNARRSAGNFTPDALREAVQFCHARSVAVHVALNTLVYADELSGLADAVRAAAQAGADAVIADDLAAAQLVRAIAPDLRLHGSTQMSIHTAKGAEMLARLGYSRVILARELSLAEIAEIVRACPIECEVFVHGAMCMSMSGQCMMSAFLGGRSGNRGACAGPCRLPFDASPGLRPGQPGKACHLSLKDMDLVPHMAELQAAGVASVKIEGRLRTPEYAAAAVTACRAARAGEGYDEALLRDIFSRSGFSDAYLTGRCDGAMFGVRTEADAAATRAAAPKARALFRRELARVPVSGVLTLTDGGAVLTLTDGDGRRASARFLPPQGERLAPARSDPAPALKKSLCKTGGTPFLVTQCEIRSCGGAWFLPASAVNELRRQALDDLLAQRSAPTPRPVREYALPEYPAHAAPHTPALAARFERADQLPSPEWTERLRGLILPIGQADAVPPSLRAKTLLELPRAAFGAGEAALLRQLDAVKDAGFPGVVANNLAAFGFCSSLPLYGGLGLNVTNPMAAARYAALGARGLLLQPEAPLPALRAIAPQADGVPVPTAALCYGHLPLMLTRACPLHNLHGCAGCRGAGRLRDRKGRDFAVRCTAPGRAGMRTVYNPVPLYMGDRLNELPVDLAVAAFTTEPPARVPEVLRLLLNAQPFDGEFTRGKYYRG